MISSGGFCCSEASEKSLRFVDVLSLVIAVSWPMSDGRVRSDGR